MNFGLNLVEAGWVPDFITSYGIRRLCQQRLDEEMRETADQNLDRMVKEMKNRKVIAEATDEANEQHYELPPPFFEACLGDRLKYSCCFYSSDSEKDNWDLKTLNEAEEAALALVCERAQLANGQDVLELGCGWGSLTLFMAEKYPKSRIVAVSNSAPQRKFIEGRARQRGLSNVTVITCDMNVFQPPDNRTFDRIVSVEMFEHMRNYSMLFKRVASWLRDADSMLFIHVFCHRSHAYFYDESDQSASNWMAKHFFSGGVMPSERLYEPFADEANLALVQRWRVNGRHYEKTCRDWLANMDAKRNELMNGAMRDTYGPNLANQWFNRWRIFYLSCAELFGFNAGEEWFVSHSVWKKK